MAFEIVDMLKQSISMGKKYSSDQYSTTAFTDSGAAGTVESYIKNALDVSKQDILATVGQAFMLDENGFRMRKWLADRSGYEPEQIWMNNNAINFTSDNWEHVRTALGKVQVGDGTLYGLVAEVIIGTLIAGKNLHINTEKEDGKPMTFKVDGAGVRLYNGNIYLSMDGGGKILLDPAHGILLGTSDLFAFDDNDQVTVDKTKANMWLDMEGVIHLEGVKAQGDIEGSTIKGSEIYIGGNNTAANCKFGVDKAGNIIGLETLNGKLKFDSDGKAYFKNDVEISGDLTLSGNINMSGGNITWGSNIPNKQRFAASTSGPWHDTMQSGDIYCCDWNYGSSPQGWGVPYKKVGTDGTPGKPGDDATVPKYITETVISKGVIEAPRINANEFGIYPPDEKVEGGSFNLHGNFEEQQYHFLTIEYGKDEMNHPQIQFTSPGDAGASWYFNTTQFFGNLDFYGNVDFSRATKVVGVTATFG